MRGPAAMLAKGFACAVALAVSGICGANAISVAQTRSDPQSATALSIYNAAAYERLAVASAVPGDDGLTLDVSEAVDPALKAFELSALATDAGAIVALSAPQPEQRLQGVDAMSRLSLRGRLLNFSVMQAATESGDTQMALSAIDRVLVLYDDLRRTLLTYMVTSLADDEMVPAFEQVLASDPEWADLLFVQGARDRDALRNLARLRINMADVLTIEPRADRALLAQLVRREAWDEAFALYDDLYTGPPMASDGALDWSSDYPPFNWSYADQREFRARPSPDDTELEVRIDGGSGGEFARRLVVRPEGALGLVIEHTLAPHPGARGIDIAVRCAQSGAELGTADFGISPVYVTFADEPCTWIEVSMSGRVSSRDPDLRAKISSVRFVDQ